MDFILGLVLGGVGIWFFRPQVEKWLAARKVLKDTNPAEGPPN